MDFWYLNFGMCQSKQQKYYKNLKSRVLRCTVNAPWYIRNDNLHKDLDVETVESVIKKYAQSHEKRPQRHINVEVQQLLIIDGLPRRLKRTKPFELVQYILL